VILNRIIEYKKREVAKSKANFPQYLLERNLPEKSQGPLFKKALAQPGISLIAEVKKASPSKGVLKNDFVPAEIALVYENGGARAISVLTDNKFFQGSIDNLKRVKTRVSLPVLRKDFIIDSYQIYETREMGADALLLIAAILEEQQLKEFISLAQELQLDTLVEVHSEEELETALNCGAEIIGINNRDLKTFKTDITTTLDLACLIPEHCLVVSESGISTGQDVRRLAEVGIDAILVGEALVTSPDIQTKIQELLKEGS